jgi:hypothetical protein
MRSKSCCILCQVLRRNFLLSHLKDSVETLGDECTSDMLHIQKYLKDHINLDSQVVSDLEEALKDFGAKQDKVDHGHLKFLLFQGSQGIVHSKFR